MLQKEGRRIIWDSHTRHLSEFLLSAFNAEFCVLIIVMLLFFSARRNERKTNPLEISLEKRFQKKMKLISKISIDNEWKFKHDYNVLVIIKN